MKREKGFTVRGAGFRVWGFALAFCSLLSAAFAVTYRVDPANGPETLAAEVKEAFDAWVALSDKVEASETQENPEGIFQYGATERFGPDTLSLTVQRQQEGRSLIFLISPNAENRRRILLHETGIAIGLEPQIPGTPLPVLPGTPTDPPADETGQSDTFETTPLPETPATPESTPETPAPTDTESTEETSVPTEEQSTTEEQTPEEQITEEQSTSENQPETENQTAPDSTSEQPTDTQSSEGTPDTTPEASDTATDTETTESTSTDSSETTTTETTPEQPSDEQTTDEQPPETPTATLIPNSVMNPSIGPDDSTELGDFERQLIDRLQLFVSQDINRDGVVNFYDLVALSQAFGRRDVNDPADINQDGVVDQADVEELQSVYTFSDPSETAPGSSPTEETEPTDGSTPPEGTTPEGTPPPEQTPPDGTPPDDLPPPQEDGSLPDSGSTDGSGE